MKFWLGSHRPHWLGTASVPLFVSHRTLDGRRTYPRAVCEWALDSGAFTELTMHGYFVTAASDYARAVERYSSEVGKLAWAAPQDWMCEPFMLRKTGLTVAEHQSRTIASVLALRDLGAPVIPVLQGWAPTDYLAHAEQYDAAGIDLLSEPIVGVGSVCRRQSTSALLAVLEPFSELGLRLHGFGVKLTGLALAASLLASSDSMAWSFTARRSDPLPGCEHRSCANCLRYALLWRERVLSTVNRHAGYQLALAV